MKLMIQIICAFSLIAMPAGAQTVGQEAAQEAGQEKDADKAQLVSTAEITKIDAGKKTLKVRNISNQNRDNVPANRNGRTGGRRGRVGYPGPGGRRGGGRRGPPPAGGGTGTNSSAEYKVITNNDTVLKEEDRDLRFEDLRVGDRITVSGVHNGSASDLQATKVSRLTH